MFIARATRAHPWILFLIAGVPSLIFMGLEVFDYSRRGFWEGMPVWANLSLDIALLILPPLIALIIGFALIYLIDVFSRRLNHWRAKIYLSVFFIIWNPLFCYLCLFLCGMQFGDYPPQFSDNWFLVTLTRIVVVGFPLVALQSLAVAVGSTVLAILLGEFFAYVLTRFSRASRMRTPKSSKNGEVKPLKVAAAQPLGGNPSSLQALAYDNPSSRPGWSIGNSSRIP